MKGSRVAIALGRVAEQRQDFDKSLLECLTKYVHGTLLKAPTLDILQSIASASGNEFSEWVLDGLSPAALDKTLKAIDPHSFKSLTSTNKLSHAKDLMFGRVSPKPRPPSARRIPGQRSMPTAEILKLGDRNQQRSELGKLSPAQLKKAIKDHELYGSSLSKKPSKTELVEHILAVLDVGWPKTGSVLDGSRY